MSMSLDSALGKDRTLWIAAGVVIVVALYVLINGLPLNPGVKTNESFTDAETLVLKSMIFGKGITDYAYSYDEAVNGYSSKYTLIQNNGSKSMEIVSPLSHKRIYLLRNGTNILCIRYPNERAEVCSILDAQDERINSYLKSLNSRFLDDMIMDRNVEDARFLLQNKYIRFAPGSGKTTSGDCKVVNYTLDFNSMPISEAVRFGVNTNSPKTFAWALCIRETGETVSRTFNFSIGRKQQINTYQLRSFGSTSEEITAPMNLTDGAKGILEQEKEGQARLTSCFIATEGEQKDKCVAAYAISEERKDICEFSGERRDRCLVAIVPLTKDKSICQNVRDSGFKDDCYIELAGAYKNNTYCNSILNSSKISMCMNVSIPYVPMIPTSTNATSSINATDANTTTNLTDTTNSSITDDILNTVETTNTTSGVIIANRTY